MEIDFLTCFMCKVTTIPAPEGATEETRYICAKCSGISAGIKESTPHFDRCAFDRALASDQPAGNSFRDKDILGDGLDSLASKPSADVSSARQRGEKWAAHASPVNLRALPEKCRRALLLTMWAGLTSAEAGKIMEIEAQTVRYNAMRAKKLLAKFNGDINDVRDKRNDHRQRELVHGKPGRKTGKEIEAKETLVHAA